MATKASTDKASDVVSVLSMAQKELKVPKSNENKFGGYKYRSCEDILEAVKKILPEGAILTIKDDIVQFGDRFYIKATATLMVGNQMIETTGFARESLSQKGMSDSQLTGACSSYARKYALNGLFCIDDTKDADATNDHGKSSKGDFKPIDKSKKETHAEWKNAIDAINNAEDADSALAVGRHQWKRLKELGATEQELDLIEDQAKNHAAFLGNKQMDGANGVRN